MERFERSVAYISEVLCEPSAATRLADGFQLALNQLKDARKFRIIDTEVTELVGEPVFRIKLDNYKLLYTVNEDDNRVTIETFAHDRQDISRVVATDF